MLALLSLALASPERLVLAHLTLPEGVEASSARVELVAGEKELELQLLDDGSGAADVREDNTWMGEGELAWSRWTAVSLYATRPGEEEQLLYQGYELTDKQGPLRFGWSALVQPEGLVVRRSVAGWPGSRMPVDPSRPTRIIFGWGAIVLIWVGVLAVLRLKRR